MFHLNLRKATVAICLALMLALACGSNLQSQAFADTESGIKGCKFKVPRSNNNYLGQVPQKTGERDKDYNADAYRTGSGATTYVVKTIFSNEPVGVTTLQYSKRGSQNIATIKVCANAQTSAKFPVLAFTFGQERVAVTILDSQTKTVYPNRPAHTTTVQTVVDAH